MDSLQWAGGPLTETEARNLNILTLAFVGDGVHTLFIRTQECVRANLLSAAIHRRTAARVKAAAQAAQAEVLFGQMTPEEQAVYKRGRNAKMHTMPKNADCADYKKATGLEAVLGYLYLTGNSERLQALLTAIGEMQEKSE